MEKEAQKSKADAKNTKITLFSKKKKAHVRIESSSSSADDEDIIQYDNSSDCDVSDEKVEAHTGDCCSFSFWKIESVEINRSSG